MRQNHVVGFPAIHKRSVHCYLSTHSIHVVVILCAITVQAFSQGVAINETNTPADPSALLDVSSTTKGILIPRMMKSERDAIVNPATGLIICQTDYAAGLYVNIGIPSSPSWTPVSPWGVNGLDIAYTTFGNVGIGSTHPLFRFNVTSPDYAIRAGNDSAWITLFTGTGARIGLADGHGHEAGYILATRNSTGAAGLRIVGCDAQGNCPVDNIWCLQDGKVGIGTDSPDQQFSVNGDASKPGGGSWSTFSDRRLKKDVHPFRDGLAAVKEINPVTFRYNGKLGYPTDKTYVGIIAQEIQAVAPYTVHTYRTKLNSEDKEETDVLQFDPNALTYISINAIKELSARVEELTQFRAEAAELRSELSKINHENILLKNLNGEVLDRLAHFEQVMAKVSLSPSTFNAISNK